METLGGSFYARAVERYHYLFGPNPVLVLFNEDLDADAPATFRKLFAFLNVDPDFVPDIALRPNISGTPRSRTLCKLVDRLVDHSFIKLVHRAGPEALGQQLEIRRSRFHVRYLQRATLSPDREHSYNRSIFGGDIARLEDLLDRDLSRWLGPKDQGK